MIDTASGFGIDERSHITVTEFVAQSYGSTHREERKAQPQKSLNSEEIIRTGTGISRIGRIYTDPGAQRLEKAPKHGDAMIVSLPRNNKPQINADKRRLIAFYHRKGRDERKAKVVFQTGLTGSTGWFTPYGKGF